jgi:hypothetical protein
MSSGAKLFDELVRSRPRSRVAAKLLAIPRHEGRTILVLKDPGGEPLDRILERDQGQPLDLTRFLRIAIGLATALGHAHRHRLLHEEKWRASFIFEEVAAEQNDA